LDEKEQQMLAFIQQEAVLDMAYRLTQQFLQMMKVQQAKSLEAWIGVCSACEVPELEAFAIGLQRDVPALQAAFSLPYSNGPTEGHINRLKAIKRSMYGRGSFELLRQRVRQSASSDAA
jgi:transposase